MSKSLQLPQFTIQMDNGGVQYKICTLVTGVNRSFTHQAWCPIVDEAFNETGVT